MSDGGDANREAAESAAKQRAVLRPRSGCRFYLLRSELGRDCRRGHRQVHAVLGRQRLAVVLRRERHRLSGHRNAVLAPRRLNAALRTPAVAATAHLQQLHIVARSRAQRAGDQARGQLVSGGLRARTCASAPAHGGARRDAAEPGAPTPAPTQGSRHRTKRRRAAAQRPSQRRRQALAGLAVGRTMVSAQRKRSTAKERGADLTRAALTSALAVQAAARI